ncbi:MAG: 16S rRNA processing protein RimM [Acidobacteria bacterium]|nr:MAG: 16S rRNA processing protein RimM [Acidobacteriota bacterium]
MRSPSPSQDEDPFSPPQSELFAIARLTKTRGLRGEVVAHLLTDHPERFAKLHQVYVQRPDGELVVLQLERHWFHQGRIILKFVGYDTIEQAQQLVGGIVKIGREELVELGEDEYFHFQLIGCQVVTRSGTPIGTVTEIMETAGTPLLVVHDEHGGEHLIPFAKSICSDVDVQAKLIRIDPPEGLLEL